MIIKENTYIRTKNGKIDKLVDNYISGITGGYIWGLRDSYNEDEIKTFSDDIFDLLEDGDYVNGLKIHTLIIKNRSIVKEKIFYSHSYDYDNADGTIHTYVFRKDGGYPIYSIVAKEMFEEVGFDV